MWVTLIIIKKIQLMNRLRILLEDVLTHLWVVKDLAFGKIMMREKIRFIVVQQKSIIIT